MATQWFEVFSPARSTTSLASSSDGMSWRILVVDGRVAAGSGYPHCPAYIGEEWSALVERWKRWGGWRVETLGGGGK